MTGNLPGLDDTEQLVYDVLLRNKADDLPGGSRDLAVEVARALAEAPSTRITLTSDESMKATSALTGSWIADALREKLMDLIEEATEQ